MNVQKGIEINRIVQHRLLVDGLCVILNHPTTPEESSLRLAKAWLGAMLGELGKESPYRNDGKRETAKDVEPAAETAQVVDAIIKSYPDIDYPLHKAFITSDMVGNTLYIKDKGFSYYSDLSEVAKLDWMREQIKKVLTDFMRMKPITGGPLLSICVTNVYTHLSEARFHLGFALGRIRDNQG